MAKKKDKTVFAVVGVILTLFGVIGTIPILLNKEYLFGLSVTAIAVIGGIILIAWSVSD